MACSGWCPPTIVYLILTTVAIMFSIVHPDVQTTNERIAVVAAQVLNGAIWTAILYWLCSICYEGWAWFFLLLPLVLAFVFMLLMTGLVLSFMRQAQTPQAPPAQHQGGVKERMSNYPINDSGYTALPIDNPAIIDNVCQFRERPAKFLSIPGSALGTSM